MKIDIAPQFSAPQEMPSLTVTNPDVTTADQAFLNGARIAPMHQDGVAPTEQNPFGLTSVSDVSDKDRFAGVTDQLNATTSDMHRLATPVSADEARRVLDDASISREQAAVWKKGAESQYNTVPSARIAHQNLIGQMLVSAQIEQSQDDEA